MNLAIIGCGFIADDYVYTLAGYPELRLVGVMDKVAARAERLAAYWKIPRTYPTLQSLLDDPSVELVLNLTNPHAHYQVTRACLLAGKHVFSEKPLAMAFEQAEDLVELAEARGLSLTSAPCSLLGETAQTLWKVLRQGMIGQVRVVYAELDDGMVHRMNYREWCSPSGAAWPYRDEFEVGCTMEHAAYYLSWLGAFFGPARSVTAFADCLIPDKGTDVPLRDVAPDFSVACIEYESGVVARLTCSIVSPHDHSLHIIGDDGVLATDEAWNYDSPVYLRRGGRLARLANRIPMLGALPALTRQHIPLVRKADFPFRLEDSHRMDFMRGVADQAAAIREGRTPTISARFALHINELVLAIQCPAEAGATTRLKTTFEPVAPMPWARP